MTSRRISRHDGACGAGIGWNRPRGSHPPFISTDKLVLPSLPRTFSPRTPAHLSNFSRHDRTTDIFLADGTRYYRRRRGAPMLRRKERGGPCALERRRLRTGQAEAWRRGWYVIAFVHCLVERAIEEGSEQPAISLSAFGCAIGK